MDVREHPPDVECVAESDGFLFILHDNRCDVQKNKKCIKTIQKKNEFCISRQLCEKNKSGKTNISSDKEKH